MAIPRDELARATEALMAFCAKVPDHVRDRVEHTFRVESHSIILISRYRSGGPKSQWFDEEVAKFRYFASREEWDLYWMDRNSKWRVAGWRPPAKRFTTLLNEVEKDSTHLFWG